MSVRRFVLPLLGLALIAGGCTRVTEDRDDLAAAIYRTETLARQFTYTEKFGTQTTLVGGSIVDDYRFRVEATGDGRLLASETVSDDARALRVLDPQLLANLTASGRAAPATTDALTQGKWVVDSAGANQLFSTIPRNYEIGTDPLHDALSILKYVRSVVGESAGVLKFNPESQDYRPKFDPFPSPPDGVIRYDLVTPVLTPRDPNSAGASVFRLPGPQYFRRMSVYVEGGVVVQIRERISIEDTLEDPRSRLEARIRDYNIDLPENASTVEKAAYLLGFLNAAARQTGEPAIRPRDLEVAFTSLLANGAIDLPSAGPEAVTGSLTGLRDYGQVLFEET